MKIDEPKTPYVTDEEFKKLCEDDPDYAKEFGNEVDFNSQEADNDKMSEEADCRMITDDFAMQLNRNLDRTEALSDDEGKSSPNKSGTKKDLEGSNQYTNTSKKTPGSSLDVATKF